MITKMKKLSFLVYAKEYEEFLLRLRNLGVVHVVERRRGELDEALAQLQQKLHTYELTQAKIHKLAAEDDVANEPHDTVTLTDLDSAMNELSAVEQRMASIQQELAAIEKDEDALQVWGDFSWQLIADLRQAGWNIEFYCCAEKDYDDGWDASSEVIPIVRQNGKIYLVSVTNGSGSLPLEPLHLPMESLSELKARRTRLGVEQGEQTCRLKDLCRQLLAPLDEGIRQLRSEADLMHVRLSGDTMAADTVVWLEGWIPAAKAEELSEAMEQPGLYLEISNPTPEDEIPIQMVNNKFFSLFEPLTKLYMLPSNGELDLTPYFAPFFMLFFGLCLGDIGYGALMILAMPVFDKLFKLINPNFSKWLVPLFGGSTMICGLLTGSAFGFSLYDIDLPFFQNMKSMFYLDNQQMFTLSLVIGVVQILFGMVLKAVNQTIQLGFKYSLATIGWIVLLVTTGVSVVSGAGFGHPVVATLLVVSAVMIFLLNSPGKNPFLNIGLGLWDAYNMVTGLLGDVLSYVRLFALGLSGGILASVFNSLAVGMSPKTPVIGFLVTALIFLAGHAINIFMNFLGAIVHPMRLTFVEFFKNAGYTGGGKEYTPFKNNK
ncbi:MAG: V-type ATPase 116kDa subunit family protein [Bacteroidales bacterium]|nr:V-type ATPase 116kDa subunit family protein [Bacteroidales bacterium]